MMHSSRKKVVVRVIILVTALIAALFVWCLFLPHVGQPEYYHSLEKALQSPDSVQKLRLAEKGLTEVPEEVSACRNCDALIFSATE